MALFKTVFIALNNFPVFTAPPFCFPPPPIFDFNNSHFVLIIDAISLLVVSSFKVSLPLPLFVSLDLDNILSGCMLNIALRYKFLNFLLGVSADVPFHLSSGTILYIFNNDSNSPIGFKLLPIIS